MNAEFIAEEGVLKGLIFSLQEGDKWIIGRDPTQVDIVLEDVKIARKHLLCKKTSDGYVIENLSEENPVLVNGTEIKGSHLLKEADRVTIGETELSFYPEGAPGAYAFEPEYAFETPESFLQEDKAKSEKPLEGKSDAQGYIEPDEEKSSEEKPSNKEPEEQSPAENEPFEEEGQETAEEEEPVQEESEGVEEEIFEREEEIEIPLESKLEDLEEGEELLKEPTEEKFKEEYEEESLFVPLEESEEKESVLKHEDIFQEVEENENVTVDLTPSSRFIIKVIAGPNTGAEFALILNQAYLIGTDTSSCDLIFNDLSVSREHARLTIDRDGNVIIEDLGSRNGILVDKERITAPYKLVPNSVVALGTSVFILIDRHAPSETIVAPIFHPVEREKYKEEKLDKEPEKEKELVEVAEIVPKHVMPSGSFVISLIIAGLAVLFGIGMVSLLQVKEVVIEKKDHTLDLQKVLHSFPAVQFTYNHTTGKLFLMGHVETSVRLNELLYELKGLSFVRGIENNIINDEIIWQEMNILLSKISDFKGVSMHSPRAGIFVISGYLGTEKQAANLNDYLNLNFNYLNLLQNRVIIEQQIVEQVLATLLQHNFGSVNVSFVMGELLLTGYISSNQSYDYNELVEDFKNILGVRAVKNFVVTVSPEQSVVDLNKKYPGKYRITGFSKYGDVNINVVINGIILSRGDEIDGMTIISIQPRTVFLEREGVRYRIEYNR